MGSGPSWTSIDRMEQARWAKLVRAHADHNDTCAKLRRRLDNGGRLEAHECAALGRLAVEHGWHLPTAGRARTKPKGRRRRG